MTGATAGNQVLKGVHEVLPQHGGLRGAGGEPAQGGRAASSRRRRKPLPARSRSRFAPGRRSRCCAPARCRLSTGTVSLHEGVAPAYDRGVSRHGSTDVGDVSWIAPTGQITTAAWVLGAAGHSWQITATCGMGIGHKAMITAAEGDGAGRLRADDEARCYCRRPKRHSSRTPAASPTSRRCRPT